LELGTSAGGQKLEW